MENGNQLRGFARFLYTQNPFYLISACLVLYGLHVSFGGGAGRSLNPWSMALGLCGYTLLMALTAVVLIRFGKIWDDARSIVLILLLLFLAISVSFDEVCRTDYGAAVRVLLAGLAFSALVSEGLFHCLQIRFPLLIRVPYHLFLFLLFVYPLWVSNGSLSDEAVAWHIFLFPVIAGLVALTLIPAIRRRREYVENNGTPWRWPLYPWTVFAFLAFAVCFRSFVLCLSFDPKPAAELSSAFGLFYLVPFLFAVLILILEIGIAESRVGVQRFAFAAAPTLLLLSIPIVKTAAFNQFLLTLTDAVGSPIWLTWIGVLLFFGYAYMRGLGNAEIWLCLALVLASFVDRHTLGLSTLAPAQWWPLAVVGLIQLIRAIKLRRSLRCFAAVACLLLAVTAALWETEYRLHALVITYHLVAVLALLISVVFQDRHSGILRMIAAMLVAVAGVGTLAVGHQLPVPLGVCVGYALVLIVGAIEGWRIWREAWWLLCAAVNFVVVAVLCIRMSSDALLEIVGRRGFYPLVGGLIFFVVAGLISAEKCGLLKKMWDKCVVAVIDPPPATAPPDVTKSEAKNPL